MAVVAVVSAVCSSGIYVGWSVTLVILGMATLGGFIAKTCSVQIIRLMAAVAIAFASCYFVVAYDQASHLRFQSEHPEETLSGTQFGRFVMDHGTHAYVVPVAGLLAGAFVIWRSSNSHSLIEVIVSTLWLLSFVWAGLTLINWQMQNIPVFSGMRWHY